METYLGRKDSLKASLTTANQMILASNFALDLLISNFQAQGLDIVDLVTLSGTNMFHPLVLYYFNHSKVIKTRALSKRSRGTNKNY